MKKTRREPKPLRRVRWATRRLRLPVPRDALVLEIGGGHNPYPRSNVVVDYTEENVERAGDLLTDRPLILSPGENLPFVEKSFDFVVASHVLEHSAQPEQFIREMQRVGRAGYIEVPVGIRERICPGPYHRLAIYCRNETLLIYKKSAPVDDPSLVAAFETAWGHHAAYRKFREEDPSAFSLRFFWKGTISHEVLNPEVDAGWDIPAAVVARKKQMGRLRGPKEWARSWARFFFAPKNKITDVASLTPILRCPRCEGKVRPGSERFSCASCSARFPKRDRLLDMR